jgi:uncharacterized protein involved in response to NO
VRQLPVIFAAPHRAMFLGGTAQGVLSMLWWAFDLGARHAGLWPAMSWALPPSWLHALAMIYGFFPFFFFGFLMTAAPRWQDAPPVAASVYVPCFLLLTAGWLGVDASLFWPGFQLLQAGLSLVLAGWLVACLALWRIARHPHPDRRHPRVVAVALSLGATGVAAYLAYASGGPAWLLQWAFAAGIWGCLLPVFTTVAHRMLPFFSSTVIPSYRVRRPFWALWLLLAAYAAHVAQSLAGRLQWLWLADLPAAATALALTVVWQLRQSFASRILAVLHIGFAWLGIALLLHGVQSLALLSGRAMWGLAPLHALTVGFFVSMLIGMVSRVTLGHSGRAVAAEAMMWFAFWGIQVAALLRIAAELLPYPGPLNLMWLSALVWLASFGAWTVRYAPAYWQARVDGRPG